MQELHQKSYKKVTEKQIYDEKVKEDLEKIEAEISSIVAKENHAKIKKNHTRVNRDKPRNFDFGSWTLDFFYGLRMTQCYQLDRSLSQRFLRHFFANVLIEHVGHGGVGGP